VFSELNYCVGFSCLLRVFLLYFLFLWSMVKLNKLKTAICVENLARLNGIVIVSLFHMNDIPAEYTYFIVQLIICSPCIL